MDYVSKAIKTSKHWHTESTFLHSQRVAEIASELILEGMSLEEIKAIAYLHDILEDTDISFASLQLEFGNKIAFTVSHLTRRDSETYFEYIQRVRDESPLVQLIKRADLIDHMSQTSTLTYSLKKRYKKALKILNHK